MIKVQSLTKYFGKKQVLNNLSFTVNDGEVYGLLGQNAAGKTTTLRILSTLLKPSAGTVTINDFDILKDPLSVRKIVGFLPEESGLYDRLTPQEILLYYGKLHGMNGKKLHGRIELLFSNLELNDFANIKCSVLSKGVKQKVSIARTLVHDPLILFLDEPTANVDVISSINIKNIILHKIKEQRTIILSTHNMYEVERMCDRIGIINEGKMIVEGTLEELKESFNGKDLEDVFVKVIRGNNG